MQSIDKLEENQGLVVGGEGVAEVTDCGLASAVRLQGGLGMPAGGLGWRLSLRALQCCPSG